MVTPNLADVVGGAIGSQIADVFTCAPARVVSYDETERVAKVELCIQRPIVDHDSDGEVSFEALPQLYDVPVLFGKVVWKLDPGDEVLVMFGMLDSSRWRETGEPGPPGVLRLHGLASPFALPGLAHRGAREAVGSATVVLGSTVRLGSHLSAEVGAVAIAQAIETELVAAITGAATTPGPAVDNGAAFKTALITALSGLASRIASPTVNATKP